MSNQQEFLGIRRNSQELLGMTRNLSGIRYKKYKESVRFQALFRVQDVTRTSLRLGTFLGRGPGRGTGGGQGPGRRRRRSRPYVPLFGRAWRQTAPSARGSGISEAPRGPPSREQEEISDFTDRRIRVQVLGALELPRSQEVLGKSQEVLGSPRNYKALLRTTG